MTEMNQVYLANRMHVQHGSLVCRLFRWDSLGFDKLWSGRIMRNLRETSRQMLIISSSNQRASAKPIYQLIRPKWRSPGSEPVCPWHRRLFENIRSPRFISRYVLCARSSPTEFEDDMGGPYDSWISLAWVHQKTYWRVAGICCHCTVALVNFLREGIDIIIYSGHRYNHCQYGFPCYSKRRQWRPTDPTSFGSTGC